MQKGFVAGDIEFSKGFRRFVEVVGSFVCISWGGIMGGDLSRPSGTLLAIPIS